jgi:hypothetical protein
MTPPSLTLWNLNSEKKDLGMPICHRLSALAHIITTGCTTTGCSIFFNHVLHFIIINNKGRVELSLATSTAWFPRPESFFDNIFSFANRLP